MTSESSKEGQRRKKLDFMFVYFSFYLCKETFGVNSWDSRT